MEHIRDRVDSCVLATCCHGICDWKEYVGRDYLRKAMEQDSTILFGKREFDLMLQWCAGTVVCQSKRSLGDDKGEQTTGTERNIEKNVDDAEDEPEHNTAGNTIIGDAPATEMNNHRVNISAVVSSLHLECGVEGLGRACQRLIDYGRLEYLRHVIFSSEESSTVKLVHYVPPEITPQNACLIARRHADVDTNKK